MEVVNIVLVEDNPGHARLIEKHLLRAQIASEIHICVDGQEALDYMFGSDRLDADESTIILLDLNLPVLSGFQVLERLKADPRTANTPVIVLTTSRDSHEVSRCYGLGCNMYLTKPVDYEHFKEAISGLGSLLSVVQVPEQSSESISQR